LLFAQKEKLSEFYLLQRRYESRPENDSSALPLVAALIKKAKKEHNQRQLFLGYTDARYYSPDPCVKLKYADSAIYVAMASKNDSLLSSAYLSKGIVYYFYLKKYKLALHEYLKAFAKNKMNKDPYYRNKINYHIGVVKSYIGYYQDALSDFEEARDFFENEIKKDLHPNVMYGNQRGYINTLHQMAVCYRNLHNFKMSDSIVKIGITSTWKNAEYQQEHSYFLKEEGINRYQKKDYAGAVKSLQNSLHDLVSINDFAWLSVSYAYLGKAKWKSGNVEGGIKEFIKVDSIFNKHSFVLPEVREVYEELIEYYNKKNNSANALYYTMQLIKVDKVLEKDFLYLSSKIHKEYDSNKLLQEKVRLQRKITIRGWIFIITVFLSVFISFYIILLVRSRKKGLVKNSVLGIKLAGSSSTTFQYGTFRIRQYTKSEMAQEIVDDILNKLSEFELNKGFLESKTDLKSLALKFGVKSSYLSNVINEYKGASFNRYLSELRINYITEKLKNEPLYRKYTSTTLANECGIASRTNFSALFTEINGMSFSEYLNQFKERDVKVDS